MTIAAYPLAWPEGWPRATSREYARFSASSKTYDTQAQRSVTKVRDVSVSDGTARVMATLRRMGLGADDVVISTNVILRLDGLPRSNQPEPCDPGVAVYWQTKKGERKVMAIDRFTRVGDNLAAVAASLEALRGIDRWGGGQILDRAFSGFTALPPPGQTTARGWREILGVDAMERDLSRVQERYRRLAAVHHPDRGGTQDKMAELNWAWTQASEALSGASS
ncbi:MAG: J domain-containing protein [Burkholderiales bacterium]